MYVAPCVSETVPPLPISILNDAASIKVENLTVIPVFFPAVIPVVSLHQSVAVIVGIAWQVQDATVEQAYPATVHSVLSGSQMGVEVSPSQGAPAPPGIISI